MSEPIRVGPIGDVVRRNVRRLREQQRLNQGDITAKLQAAGYPMLTTVFSKTERGQRRVDVDDLVALAAVLGVTPAQLLEPPTDCATCCGTPPPGFTCRACGAAQ